MSTIIKMLDRQLEITTPTNEFLILAIFGPREFAQNDPRVNYSKNVIFDELLRFILEHTKQIKWMLKFKSFNIKINSR